MKRTLSTLLLFVLSATLVPAVYADSGCTDATLTGSYSFNVSGWYPSVDKKGHLILPNSTITNFVGTAIFDGAGHFSTSFVSCNTASAAKVVVKGRTA